MGLFGLFYTLFCGIGHGIAGFNESVENDVRRTTKYNSRYGTYVDVNGCERLASDNRKVRVYRDIDGDLKIKDLKTLTVLRNISKEDRQELWNSRWNTRGSVIKWDEPNIGNPHIHGQLLKDKETGDYYYEAWIYEKPKFKKENVPEHLFYIDAYTGQIVRPSDKEYKSREMLLHDKSNSYKTDEWYREFANKRNGEIVDFAKKGFNENLISLINKV